MTQTDVKWRQPLLSDGSPVPVAAYSNRTEARVEFSISCRYLLDHRVEDVRCFCVAYSSEVSPLEAKGDQSGVTEVHSMNQTNETRSGPNVPTSFVEIGRTEVVYNSSDPDFSTVFQAKISTSLEKLHDIIIVVYGEEDVLNDDLGKQQYLGCVRFRLEHVLRATNFCESQPLETGGFVTMTAKPSWLDSEFLVFCFSGKGFKKVRKYSVIKAKKKVPKNPYIVISYENKKHSKWRVLWKSEAVSGSEMANFGFGHFQISRVNGADEETPIQILAMDWDEKNHKYKTIGEAKSTLKELSTADEIGFFQKGKCTGHLVPEFVEKVHVPTIANYLVHGGVSLNVTFAVDFTSSNGGPGNPESEESLHHLSDTGEINAYETVLKNLGAIFQEYDSAPKFSLWGFGAISESAVNHRFVMGGDIGCDGVHGLTKAYSETVRSNITMSGPKLLRPTIDAAIEYAMQDSESTGNYSILIILCCDGTIGDVTEVVEKVNQASFVPLSVVFVEIGGGDFKDLKENFGSASITSLSGNEVMRDVATVVQLSDHKQGIEESMHRILEKVSRVSKTLRQFSSCSLK
uniref:C2 domain-containing protein n=1 Tax=Pseudictyota dubia TaxID=2749911 RepID=A0A7R9WGF3_9STRA|mmetsp:Transcript_48610/g.90201  ORF Transcript_48610/g.90201 Transcript_48610/m.90201 type:complete len:574 (+) Transcript_48610:120-1841(+)